MGTDLKVESKSKSTRLAKAGLCLVEDDSGKMAAGAGVIGMYLLTRVHWCELLNEY